MNNIKKKKKKRGVPLGFWILFQRQKEKETLMLFKRGGKLLI